jgi:hypothetical protein
MKSKDNAPCSYTVIASGDQHWLRDVPIPLTEALQLIARHDDSLQLQDEFPDYLYIDHQPKADGGILIGGVVGVFAFFASWLASKVLDDVYEVKFQPAIKKALGSADSKLSDSNAIKPKMLQLGFSYADKLDDLGELVLKNGGRVVVIPADRMPTKTGAAATCRF